MWHSPHWSFRSKTKARRMMTRRMMGTVMPTRMAVLSGSVLMAWDQEVSLNLSWLVKARI